MAEESRPERQRVSSEQGRGGASPTRDAGSRHASRECPEECSVPALQAAVSAKDVEGLKGLLLAGADIELRDQGGCTALHTAVVTWGHHLRNWPRPPAGLQTPLGGALARAELCLRTLCDQGASVDATLGDGSGHTALHLAARYRVPPAVPLLASYGADLDAEDGCGMTALHMASGTLQKDIVFGLIRLGARVNALAACSVLQVSHRSGTTALHLASTALAVLSHRRLRPGGLACVSALLEGGADPEAANGAGRTALQEACGYGEEPLVDLLLAHGADIDGRTAAGEGCLFLFLDSPVNVRQRPGLLSKLLCLTSLSPGGRDPVGLERAHHAALRQRLLLVGRQPRSLKDLCKKQVYLRVAHGRSGELRGVLPRELHHFVFHRWDSPAGDVSPVTEDNGGASGRRGTFH
ncbi:hypothetical protein CRUP_024739 [Coryphaenoides rupestris]|nr:hypothetical protein CRUP_024739 [Coryphaenoides rupestris]